MTSARQHQIVSRRTALAGLGLGIATAATARQASAQGATPAAMAGHPLVGTWVLDPVPDFPANAPAVAFFTADGIFTDPQNGFTGVWEPTGPNSGAFTFLGIIEGADFNGYFVSTGQITVYETGNAWTNDYAIMTVAADGTVVETSPPGPATGTRMQIVPLEAMGSAVPEVPTWEPVPPADATPEA